MTRRIVSALFFLGGLVGAWFAIRLASAYGKSQAAMSAGPTHLSSTGELLEFIVPLLIYGYFLVSAVGILVTKTRQSLTVVAVVSHSLLLLVVGGICIAGLEQAQGAGDLFVGLLMVVLVGFFVLTPWLAVWALNLAKAEKRPAGP